MSVDTILFLVHEPSVLDVHHAVRERQDPRIVRNNKHRARRIFRDLGQQRHDRVPVRAVQRRGRLVGVSMHPSMDNSVVLPLPDGPMSSTSSPPVSERLTPRTAATRPAPVPRYFTTSVASITGSVIALAPSLDRHG